MSIQGPFHVQNLMENETIKSDFEFAHIRHTYGTFFDIWAKFPLFLPNFQRFRFSLLRGARARQYTQNDRQSHLYQIVWSKSIMGHMWWIYDFKPIFHLILGRLVTNCTGITQIQARIFGVQKFLRYRRNFWISISGSKFQTWFTFIIFLYMTWIWPHGNRGKAIWTKVFSLENFYAAGHRSRGNVWSSKWCMCCFFVFVNTYIMYRSSHKHCAELAFHLHYTASRLGLSR